MLEKTKSFAQKPAITPLTLILVILNIAVDIAIADNPWVAVSQIFLTLALILSGVKLTDIKELLTRMKTVLQDKDTNLNEKFKKIFDIVITGCATLGVIQEEMNLYPTEYFVKKKETEPTDTV